MACKRLRLSDGSDNEVAFPDANDNSEVASLYEKIGGLTRLRSLPGPDQPTTSTPVTEDPPQIELAKNIFLGSLGVEKVPNPGANRPKPTFLEDLELSKVVQNVLACPDVSSAFELVSALNRSVSDVELSPAAAWNGGRPLDLWSQDALEYCWGEMKRLGKTQGTTRDREWAELMSACKRSRVDSDGDAIMVSVEEYAENVELVAVKTETEPSPAEPSEVVAENKQPTEAAEKDVSMGETAQPDAKFVGFDRGEDELGPTQPLVKLEVGEEDLILPSPNNPKRGE